MKTKVGFICSVIDSDVFEKNIGRSSAWLSNDHTITIEHPNICYSYNMALKKSINGILVFVHQDVYLPVIWMTSLNKALKELENVNWGVLGVAGVGFGGRKYIGHLQDRGTEWKKGWPDDSIKKVQTVDELLFVIKNNGLFIFDENIIATDLHALDLCMQAREQGKENYVIDAYLHHNSSRNSMKPLSKDFYGSYKYLVEKWKKFLPIDTTYATLK